MTALQEMRYNDDFIIANRIMTYESEIMILKKKQTRPKQYPDQSDRIKYLEALVAMEKEKLSIGENDDNTR